MVVTFRRELLSLANRTWHLGQSLLILALPVLIVLKLTGVIAWSWWWVLAPLWISAVNVSLFRFNLPGTGARIWNIGQSLVLPVLIVLKLTGVIAWSWWWVLTPLWISGIIVFLFLCLLGAGILWHRRSPRLAGDYQAGEYGEPRPRGGLAGGGWPWEVDLGRFRRSGTFRRR